MRPLAHRGFPIKPATEPQRPADTGPGNPILGGGSPRSFQLAAKFTF